MHNAFAVVIVSWLVIGAFLLVQGLYTLRTGRITPFFTKPVYSRSVRGPTGRLAYAFVYMFPGAAALIIIAVEGRRQGMGHIETWFADNLGMAVGASIFVALGLLHLFEPEGMLRWTVRTHPELSRNDLVVVTTRVIGVGLLCLGLCMFAAT
jgi:hypothetical protein